MITCERGDVVLVLFPNSNLRTAKRRPAVVVQSDKIQNGLAQTIVAMVTSNLERSGQDGRVTIRAASPEGVKMGVLADSVIMLDNLATVKFAEIDRCLGICLLMQAVDDALRQTLGL